MTLALLALILVSLFALALLAHVAKAKANASAKGDMALGLRPRVGIGMVDVGPLSVIHMGNAHYTVNSYALRMGNVGGSVHVRHNRGAMLPTLTLRGVRPYPA